MSTVKTDTPHLLEEIKWIIEDSERNAAPPKEHLSPGGKRHFVIIGTSGSHDYLKDSTGNQRFWPVKVPLVMKSNRKDDDHEHNKVLKNKDP